MQLPQLHKASAQPLILDNDITAALFCQSFQVYVI